MANVVFTYYDDILLAIVPASISDFDYIVWCATDGKNWTGGFGENWNLGIVRQELEKDDFYCHPLDKEYGYASWDKIRVILKKEYEQNGYPSIEVAKCTCDFSHGNWGCTCGFFQQEQAIKQRIAEPPEKIEYTEEDVPF